MGVNIDNVWCDVMFGCIDYGCVFGDFKVYIDS